MSSDGPQAKPDHLIVTAISAKDGVSTIERWQLASPFQTSSEAGISGVSLAQLGQAGNASYAVIPPHFEGGLHNAPAVQYVAFLAGEAIITVPETGQSVRIKGGKDGLIIAADTVDVSRKGHDTRYPSEEETVAVVIPVADGKVPEHVVVDAEAGADEDPIE
ncbi:MAG: hypothetical protein Q9184_005335 [Pyrenodesmia sp. 2 TL-2023]